MTSEISPRKYRADIDGLRCIAVVAVVLFHAGGLFLPGGFSGVDIFFVISGYLIGGHIYGDLIRSEFSYAKFYQRRAKRILPALYVVLGAVLVFGVLVLSPDEYKSLGQSALAATASASNILFWRTGNYFASSADYKPLLMTWSLGVEEQFYLVIPLLMVVLWRLRQNVLLPFLTTITAASFALSWYLSTHLPTPGFYLLPSRIWELGTGVVLAIIEARKAAPFLQRSSVSNALGLIGLAGILLPIFLLHSTTPFPGLAALPTVIGTAMILVSNGSWINNKLLSLKPAVATGRVSYSFYLWHWPILVFLRICFGGRLPLIWGLSAVGAAFGISFLSYSWIEQPFRRSQRRPGPLLLRYAAVSAGFLIVTAAIALDHGLPQRFGSGLSATAERQHALIVDDPCLLGNGSSTPSEADLCRGTQSADLIAIWGDSHAAALAPALRAIASREGYRVEEFAKTACPPLVGVGRQYRELPNHAQECITFNRRVLNEIIAEPRIKTAVLTAYWEAPFDPNSDNGKLARFVGTGLGVIDGDQARAVFESSLRSTIAQLQSSGKRVVVIGDVPVFSVDPLATMWSSRIFLRRRLVEYMTHRDAGEIDPGSERPADLTSEQTGARALLRKTALSIPGVSYWDPRVSLCKGQGICFYRISGVPLYIDTNHLSLEGGLKALDGWSIYEKQH
jgi:peptidoglycan/LPS O-acetylase OafA/YrhL